MVKKTSLSPFRQYVILGVISLIFILLLGYSALDLYQSESYLGKVRKIQNEANKKLSKLNLYYSRFQGDAATAKKFKPKFKEGKIYLKKITLQLKDINPPAKERSYHKDLIKLYSTYYIFGSELYEVADFIETRVDLLLKFSSSVKSFNNSIKTSGTEEGILSASGSLKSSADDTLNKLKRLPRPSILVYSNETLEKYLSDLSAILSELNLGIESKDPLKIKSAAKKLNDIFTRDWAKAFTEEDKKGMIKYKVLKKELETLRQQLTGVNR